MPPEDRLRLFNTLNQLTPQDLNKLIFVLKPPAGVMYGEHAPTGDKVAALLNWAESATGRGLAEVQEVLGQLDQLPSPEDSILIIGPNPYKGLLAFDEADQDRYFGRTDEIQTLWTLFRDMHQAATATRLLPIYGPSGSGKSSLARAGLLAELRRHPLPGFDQARIMVLVPGTQPLQALATVLARLVDSDSAPVKKIREFTEELGLANKAGAYDGLQRIASVLPDIATAPLVVLVDQFEEVYSLCKNNEERDQFIANLLYASQDASRYVSVIITCRSDFLGSTQQHPTLNKLFSTQGFLVPIMQPEGLAAAIAEPARLAGYEFDPATVQLLVEQARGHQGALPLLQFALQRIWEGLERGYEPLTTLEQIGGVGGALADEARQLFEALSQDEKDIAPRIFLALVQIDDSNEVTRRRARKVELITDESDIPQVDGIIKRFADPGVRFLVTSFTEEDGEVIEVAHEALIQSWTQLQEWIAECREALRQKRKIEQEAQEWERKEKAKDYLLQGRPLRDAKEFMKTSKSSQNTELSGLATEFIRTSQKARNKNLITRGITIFILPILVLTPPIFHFSVLEIGSKNLYQENCNKNILNHFLLSYRLRFGGEGKKELSNLKLCKNDLSGIDLSFGKVFSISNSDFSDTELPGANLRGIKLERVDLRRATLRVTNLKETHMVIVDFQEAELIGADLTGARCWNCNFRNANFDLATLDGVILIKSDLSNSQLNDNQINSIKICGSNLPDKFKVLPDRDCSNPELEEWMSLVEENIP